MVNKLRAAYTVALGLGYVYELARRAVIIWKVLNGKVK